MHYLLAEFVILTSVQALVLKVHGLLHQDKFLFQLTFRTAESHSLVCIGEYSLIGRFFNLIGVRCVHVILRIFELFAC